MQSGIGNINREDYYTYESYETDKLMQINEMVNNLWGRTSPENDELINSLYTIYDVLRYITDPNWGREPWN